MTTACSATRRNNICCAGLALVMAQKRSVTLLSAPNGEITHHDWWVHILTARHPRLRVSGFHYTEVLPRSRAYPSGWLAVVFCQMD